MFSPPVVVPLLIAHGPSKPENLEFMKRTLEELATIRREGFSYKNKEFEVKLDVMNKKKI